MMTTLKPSTSVFKTIVRTVTPLLISAMVWTGQRLGLHVNAGTATEVAGVVGLSLSLAVPPLEKKWRWFGLLLGWVGAPSYIKNPTKAQIESENLKLQAEISALTDGAYPAPGTPVAITLAPNA